MRRWDKSKPPQGPFALNRDSPLAAGLVAWWPMGGATGRGYAPDMVGKTHLAGTATSMTMGDAGQPVMRFVAASSQYISNASLLISAYPMTITSWFRPATLANMSIACAASGDGSGFGRKEILFLATGSVRAFDNDGVGTTGNPSTTVLASAGQWTHSAGVFTGASNRDAYINGGNAINNTTALSGYVGLGETRLGVDSSGGFYTNGDIGETCIYNVALGPDMVARQYDPATRFELWYPLRSRKWISLSGAVTAYPWHYYARQRT